MIIAAILTPSASDLCLSATGRGTMFLSINRAWSPRSELIRLRIGGLLPGLRAKSRRREAEPATAQIGPFAVRQLSGSRGGKADVRG